jgi:hypothetical protein
MSAFAVAEIADPSAFVASHRVRDFMKVGFGKHAKWVLFHPHQLQKLAQQNMH